MLHCDLADSCADRASTSSIGNEEQAELRRLVMCAPEVRLHKCGVVTRLRSISMTCHRTAYCLSGCSHMPLSLWPLHWIGCATRLVVRATQRRRLSADRTEASGGTWRQVWGAQRSVIDLPIHLP